MYRFTNKEPINVLEKKDVKTEPGKTDTSARPTSSTRNARKLLPKIRTIRWNSGGLSRDEEKKPRKRGADLSDEHCCNTDDGKLLPKEKTSCKQGNSSHDEVKKPRKLEAYSSPEDEGDSLSEESYPKVKIGSHKCGVPVIYSKKKKQNIMRALSKGSHYVQPNQELKIIPNPSGSNDEFIDKIIKSMSDILKLPLSPNTLQSSAENVEFPGILEGYEWSNDVDNPTINAVDNSLKQVVESTLVNQRRCKHILNELLTDLNNTIEFKGCTNRWNWFGSYLNGLVCIDSEIHLHYECVSEFNPKNPYESRVPEDLLQQMVKLLKAFHKFDKIESNSRIRFPRIKGKYKIPTRVLHFEITFSTDLNSGELIMMKSLLTKLYIDMSPNLKYLTVFVKMILQRRRIPKLAGEFRTYAIFWLVVFFMQLKKLLPPVIDVRKAAKVKHFVAGWDCSLPENYSYPTEPVSLYSLLLEFLDFYKNFDFLNYVICPYLGRVFLLSDFERLRIPTEEFSLYLRQVNSPHQLTFPRKAINLQDPSDLCCNVAESIRTANANKFKMVCHRLSEVLAKSVAEMENMECFCTTLTIVNIYKYSSYNHTHYTQLISRNVKDLKLGRNRENRLNQVYILEAIRKIMESVFKFEKKSIIINQSVTQAVNKELTDATIVKHTFPVIYFGYRSSEGTLKNEFIKEIVLRKEDENQPVSIDLVCEFCLEQNLIKIFIQGDVHFVNFLNQHLFRLLRFTLQEIIPDVVR